MRHRKLMNVTWLRTSSRHKKLTELDTRSSGSCILLNDTHLVLKHRIILYNNNNNNKENNF